MRRLIAGLTVLLSLLNPAQAAQETIAKAAFVVDATTGAVLLEKSADMRIPTASMSKIMTAGVVFDALRQGQISLDQSFVVSEKAWRMGGSKMFVEVGKAVPVEDLIKGVIVQSGNDATIVLAEGIAGTEEAFAIRMNQLARSWGVRNSNFVNASGWPDPNHYSTPRDLGMIAWNLVARYPEGIQYDAMREFTWNKITQANRNPLLGRVDGADGMKTGHTEEAGYGLIGTALRDGRRVIMVLSGLASAKDREAEGVRIMEWALKNFKIAHLLQKGQRVGKAEVVYGVAQAIPLTVGANAMATVPATFNAKDLQVKLRYMSPLVAPVQAGQRVGSVIVTVPGAGTQEYPLLAGVDVAKKGFIGLTLDKIIQAAKNK